MRLNVRQCWLKLKLSGNFIPHHHHQCAAFHASPHLSKRRGGNTQKIIIDASKEQIFPTRQANIKYEEEIALADKIRSARIAKKRHRHQIETQKHSSLIFEILQEALYNGRLKKAEVTWRFLEFAPKFIDDGDDASQNELDNYVQIDLIDVGFELVGATMPNHRQYCVIWWRFNQRCKLNGGQKLMEKVLDLYKGALRAIIARKMALKTTPRLIFRLVDSTTHDNAVYHKHKMDLLVEHALIEEYKSYHGLDFKREDNEEESKFKNEAFHDAVLNKIYGSWRSEEDEAGSNGRGRRNGGDDEMLSGYDLRRSRKKLADKWIETFLTKVENPHYQQQKIERRKKRKENRLEQRKDKARIINMIMSTDPNFMVHRDNGTRIPPRVSGDAAGHNPILIPGHRQSNELIVDPNQQFLKRTIKKQSLRQSANIVFDAHDLDLVGFVEE